MYLLITMIKSNYDQNTWNKVLKLAEHNIGISAHKIINRYEQKILKKKISKLVRLFKISADTKYSWQYGKHISCNTKYTTKYPYLWYKTYLKK